MKNKIFAIVIAILFVLTVAPIDALAKGFSGGGGGGFSGGKSFSSPSPSRSFSSPSPSKSYSAPSHSSPSSPSRSYSTPSAPSTPTPPRQFTTPSTPTPKASTPSAPSVIPFSPTKDQPTLAPKPPKSGDLGSLDTKGARNQKLAESKKAFETANPAKQPKQSYESLKKDLNFQKMENRQLRQQQNFSGHYNQPVPQQHSHYNDGFNIWFWLWLLDRPRSDRDTWVYNHKDQMDPARYAELKKNDTDLENRLKALEDQGVKKDSSYAPKGIDRDLMYSDEHVKKAYEDKTKSGFPWMWFLVGLIIFGVIYLVFFTKWNVKKKGSY